ncbi:hypothetical protein FDUTEX481_00833 [Tolypothrix sp. PCC 7601]|nr:hypothetical protein FDUTEX481_00833 [Tolypothrix sp. PCC 7601]
MLPSPSPQSPLPLIPRGGPEFPNPQSLIPSPQSPVPLSRTMNNQSKLE